MMELSTEEYDKLKKKYFDYLELYKFFNGGSPVGATPYDEFYWRFMYRIYYEEPDKIGVGNY